MQVLRFLHPATRFFLLAALFLPAVLSAQIKVVTNGDVGVGIDPPTVKLDVNGAIRLRAALHDIANNTGNAGQILSSTGTGVQWINPPSGGGGGGLPPGTSTQTLRYDAANVLVATSTITNDGTNVGIGSAPNALYRAFINGPLGVNGSGVFSGVGSGPGSLNAAGIRLINTSPTTGDTYYLSSENNGTAIFRGANSGIIYTANTFGDMLVNFRLGIGDVTGITPNTIIGRDANGMVGTVGIGSGLSLTGGTLTATGGGGNYTAGTGIDITGNVISNTGDTNAADDITNSTAANGDLNGTYPNPTVDGLQNRPVSATAPTNGQVLEWNGTAWAPAADDSNTYTAGTGISIAGNVITNTGDTNAGDDITTASNAAGDVTGPFSNLQIAANAVGTPEIANSAVTGAKIAQAGATNGQVLEWNGTTWAPAADDGTVYTAGAGISIAANVITNTGDTNANDDLTTASVAAGDVTGQFNNLQIAADAVTSAEIAANAVNTAEIANSAVTGAKIAQAGATNGQVLKWNGTTWAPASDDSGAPAGTSTQTLRYDASNILVANSTLTNDGTNIGVGTAPLAGIKAYVNGPIRTEGAGIHRGAGSGPGNSAAATVRLWNTTASTGDTYNLSSENDGSALFHSGNFGNIFTVNSGNMAIINNAAVGNSNTGLARLNVEGINAGITARLNPGNFGANSTVLQIGGSGSTQVYGIDENVSVTGTNLINRVRNSSTANNAATNAISQVAVAHTIVGDPLSQYIVENGSGSAVTTFSMGIDNSDNDYLKIQPTASLGTNEAGIMVSTSFNWPNNGTAYTKVGINEATPQVSLDVSSNKDAIAVPRGTTTQRPGALLPLIRYNSTFNGFEVKNNIEEPNWHRLTCFNNPTVAIGPGGGQGSGGSATIIGDDMKGTITVNVGNAPQANSIICTMSFNNGYDLQPLAVVTAANNNAATDHGKYYVSAIGLNNFMLTANGTLAPNTTYVFYYQIQN